MARRGPPPQPTVLKLLKGNPGKRKLNTREPQPVAALPFCPGWLSPEANRAWTETVSALEGMRILTLADRDALAAYCQTYARWVAAEHFLDQHGDVYPVRDEKGKVRSMQPFPQVAIARSLLQLLQSYQQELGMTPSARTRIHVLGALHEGDDDEAFFTGPRPAAPPR